VNLDPVIVEYVARESVRRYGTIDPRLPDLLRRNIRRRFKSSVARDELLRMILHYKDVYTFAASVLRSYQQAPPGKYLGKADLLMSDFLAALASRYTDEPPSILQIVADFALYYEYDR
jgi:hypothetical protein